MLQLKPVKTADVAALVAPAANGLADAVAVAPYATVCPYSNVTSVLAPLLLTVPLSVAPLTDNAVAALVVTLGALGLHAGVEATSVKVPTFAPVAMPVIVDVPVLVILPLANGVDAVGRTWIPCHVSAFVRVLISVTLNVMADAEIELTAVIEPLAKLLIFRLAVALPANTMLTVAAVLNSKPVGALIVMFPSPISPALTSVITGPVSAVHVPAALQPVAILDGIAPPPEAVVIVADNAGPHRTISNSVNANILVCTATERRLAIMKISMALPLEYFHLS